MANVPEIQLRDELQKFTGFNYTESVRALANDAVKSINRKEVPFPIYTCESPVIRAINTVLTNPKLAKSSVTIIPLLLDCIASDLFKKAALDLILKGMVSIAMGYDGEAASKFLQKAPFEIVKNFPHLDLIRTYCSIILTMMSHTNIIISTSAFATVPQIIQAIVDKISSIEGLPESYAEVCKADYGADYEQFEKPEHFVLYLLFSDLSSIALSQPIKWLFVPKPQVSMVYDLLDLIVNEYKDILSNNTQLLFVFEGTVIQALNDSNALEFVIGFIESFLESHESLCFSVFSDYMSRISARSKHNHVPLFFFRNVVTRSVNFASRVYELCDKNNELFTPLVKALGNFIEANLPSSPLDFSLRRIKLNNVMTDKGRSSFVMTSPYEICFGMLRSFEAGQIDAYKFIQRAGTDLVRILNVAMTFCTEAAMTLPCEAAKSLLVMINGNVLLADTFSTIYAPDIAGKLSEKEQKAFSVKEKGEKYMRFLCDLSENSPKLLNGQWERLFSGMFTRGITPSDQFGLIFSEEEMRGAVNGMIHAQSMNHDFIAHFVAVNHEKFGIIWEILSPVFTEGLKQEEFDMNVFNLFMSLVTKGTTKESEEKILETAALLVAQDSPLKLKEKGMLIQQIRHLLAENVTVIEKGWSYIFRALSPANYPEDQGILQTCFAVLNLICNDHFYLIPYESLECCIDIIFKYAKSNVDINLSLSSFDLLWVVVRVMKNDTESWTGLMKNVMHLMMDPRSDVSQCAVRTFGSLMSSNFKQIPNEVFIFLIEQGFPDLLQSFTLDNESKLGDIELALQELAHYTCTFWQIFSENEKFFTHYIPLLIDKQTEFTLKCTNAELVTNGFQFYECLFQCQHLDTATETRLRESIATINDTFMTIPDGSIIFSCFGRLMGRILTFMKTRNTVETLPQWFPIIRKICERCKSVSFVHITPHRTISVIPSLFPMSEETSFKVIDFLIELAQDKESPAFPEFLCDLLTHILTGDLQSEFRPRFVATCKSLFTDKVYESLMKAVLDAKIEFSEEYSDDMFACYTLIGETCPSLEKQVNASMVVLIDKLSNDAQIAFINRNKQDFGVLALIWTTFFDHRSAKFSQDVYENCFNVILENFEDMIREGKSTLEILRFMEEAVAPVREFAGKQTDKWFIVKLMPSISKLITIDDLEIRVEVQNIMLLLADFLNGRLL